MKKKVHTLNEAYSRMSVPMLDALLKLKKEQLRGESSHHQKDGTQGIANVGLFILFRKHDRETSFSGWPVTPCRAFRNLETGISSAVKSGIRRLGIRNLNSGIQNDDTWSLCKL